MDGVNISGRQTEIRQMIGVLPESHGFYRWMTGREYLLFFASMYGLPRSLAGSRADELLERVGLKDKRHSPVKQYSRGMKQRLGIAKTMIHQPKLMILDEPTLGLDPQGQRDIQQLIRELNEDTNVTVFITSHLLKEIDEICNRIAIVKNGMLLEEGTVTDLKANYSRDGEIPSLEEVFLKLTASDRG
ncbi:hypothetical protein GCM10020370_72150 [Paenibacillus hodogayensis]